MNNILLLRRRRKKLWFQPIKMDKNTEDYIRFEKYCKEEFQKHMLVPINNPTTVDGIDVVGKFVCNPVQELQRDMGTTPDGIVGAMTMKHLKSRHYR